MGFQKPNLNDAYHVIRVSIMEISSTHNDGYTSCYCKKELWQLKCWLEDAYQRLPKFEEEQEWEKQRTLEILRNQQDK